MSNILDKIADAIGAKAPPPINPLKAIGAKIVCAYPDAKPAANKVKTLAQLDAEWQSAYDATVRYNDNSARRDYHAQIHAHTGEARSGKLHEAQLHGLETLTQQYRTKMLTGKEGMKKATAEAAEIAVGILDNFVSFAELWIAAREKSEKDEHDELGLPYAPSLIVASAKNLVARSKATREICTDIIVASNGGLQHMNGRPADLMPFLDLN